LFISYPGEQEAGHGRERDVVFVPVGAVAPHIFSTTKKGKKVAQSRAALSEPRVTHLKLSLCDDAFVRQAHPFGSIALNIPKGPFPV
jgi:hypothetical protein